MNYMIKMGGGSSLPSEYQEVEYIQSSGTQYIDTGIKLSSADTVKAKFEITSKPSDYNYREGIYGTMEYISGNNTFFVLLMRTPTLARVGTSSNQVTSTNVETNKIYDTTLSNGTYIENGTTYTFTPHNGFTFNTLTCYLFKRNQSAMLPTSAKVYSFEIVGKFKGVPCYRKADGVIGFYDTVSETFFTNAGTGDFTKGNDVVAYQSMPIGVLNSKKRLPNGYQEVEYIESTGTQYINSGIIGKYGLSSYAKLSVSSEINDNAVLLASRITEAPLNNTRIYLGYRQFDGTVNVGYKTEIKSQTGVVRNTIQEYEYSLNDNYAKVKKDGVEIISDYIVSDYSNNTAMYIFGNNYNGFVNSLKCKLYSLKIYDNNTLVRDYVPCYRKSDSIIGLYDTVNGVFYTNIGNGAFLKGEDVNNYITTVTYNALKTYNN